MVKVRSGEMIDSLQFATNKGNVFGPYGGTGGGLRPDDCPPKGTTGYLSGISGSDVMIRSAPAIRNLRFKWTSLHTGQLPRDEGSALSMISTREERNEYFPDRSVIKARRRLKKEGDKLASSFKNLNFSKKKDTPKECSIS